MLRFINPFKGQHIGDNSSVLIPLERVQRYSQVPTDAEDAIELQQLENGKPEDEDDDDAPLISAYGPELSKLRAEIEGEAASAGVQTSYDLKSKVINKAIQDIGMGKYQWELFALCGMGWLADNLWMQGLALVLPQLSVEFGVDENTVRYTTMITYIGLSIGSTFWGVASDVIGRRPAFNATLLICGVFGFAAGFGPSWFGTCVLFLCMGIGVGGNLPVDGALFLEFLPFSSGKLLTLLSVWWPVGQLISCFLAWLIIPEFSCSLDLESCSVTGDVQPCCSRSDNMGWRYFIFSLGAVTLFMFVCRFFLFTLFESPKFLLSKGRQREAVSVVHSIARHNKGHTWLTEDILNAIGGHLETDDAVGPSAADLSKKKLQAFSLKLVRPLFADSKLGLTTLLIWLIWALIGIGFPLFNAFLPQYLSHISKDEGETIVSSNTVYEDLAITSIVGLPGSIVACYTVDIVWLGRKGSMAISTLVSGILLFLFTFSSSSSWQTTCSALSAFSQNIMYGVVYSYTPEVFPAPNRGTGTGIASLLNRVAGLCAPIVAATVGAIHPAAPIYAAATVYVAAFVAMCALPIETRGKQSL